MASETQTSGVTDAGPAPRAASDARRGGLALRLVPPLVAAYVRFCHRTTRWTRLNEGPWRAQCAAEGPFILTMWHSRLLMVPVLKREVSEPITAIVSEHRDGEFIARVLARFDIGSARGSAADPRKPQKAKGGASALKRLVALTRRGESAAVTPDGPRGPRQRAQPGIAQLAKLTGLTVLPLTYSMRPARFLSTWDALLVPLPFGRGVFVFGEPITVTGRGAEAMETGRQRIEDELNRITRIADEWAGHEARLPTEASARIEPLPAEASA